MQETQVRGAAPSVPPSPSCSPSPLPSPFPPSLAGPVRAAVPLRFGRRADCYLSPRGRGAGRGSRPLLRSPQGKPLRGLPFGAPRSTLESCRASAWLQRCALPAACVPGAKKTRPRFALCRLRSAPRRRPHTQHAPAAQPVAQLAHTIKTAKCSAKSVKKIQKL